MHTYDAPALPEEDLAEIEVPSAAMQAANERFVKYMRARQAIQKSFIDSGSYPLSDNTFTHFKYSKELGTINASLVKAKAVVSYDQGSRVVPLADVIMAALGDDLPAQELAEVTAMVDPAVAAELEVDGDEAFDDEGYEYFDSDESTCGGTDKDSDNEW